jgi:hypothetical protein
MSADQPRTQEHEHEYQPTYAQLSTQIIEAASWRLTAELVRRYPNRFTVIEMHPAGG